MRSAAYDPGMRRPRPHRLTGSVRRLLAAAVLGVLAAAVAVTATSGPASAAGLNLNGLNLSSPLAGLPPLLPTLPSVTPPTTPATPSLPNTGSVPGLCPPACGSTPTVDNGNTNNNKAPGNIRTGSPGGRTSSSSSGAASQFGSGSNSGSSATSTVTSPQSLGLSLAAPPPVDQLTPLAGISFGQAPFLWPLFLLLDAIAAGAVVLLVRRTWSPKSGAD
jgi:hypothetical protein